MSSKTYTVQQLAERYRMSQHSVLALIRSGAITAIDISRQSDTGKPRWRITADALIEFENRRSNRPTPKPARRRRRPENVIQYF